jgi:AMIN domain
MNCSRRAAASLLVWAAACAFAAVAAQAQSAPSVRSVRVLGKQNPVEIEIEASDRLVPQAQVLTGPDRLVVDFPNVLPGAQLRNQKLNRAEVKSVRVGLFTANPPVTRIVFDLNGPQAYQIFPSGRTVIVKVGTAGAQAAGFNPSSPSGPRLVTTNYSVQSVRITPPPEPPPLVVTFQAGKLTITSNKASLSEILFAVHQHTGADIAIPAGAEQEKVVAQIGPASAPEVLSHLLNGSRFNFLILSSATDPSTLDRVILSARPDGPSPAYQPLPQVRSQADDDVEAEAPSRTPPPPSEAPAPAGANPAVERQIPPTPPDTKAPPPSNDTPD